MEHALLRSLLSKQFYDDTRGNKCPDKLFTKDLRKIKITIDQAMDNYQRDLTVEEVQALYHTNNPTLTTAQKQAINLDFQKIKVAPTFLRGQLEANVQQLTQARIESGIRLVVTQGVGELRAGPAIDLFGGR